MAKFAFKAGEDYALKLSRLAYGSEGIAKKAVYAAAGIVTDEVRKRLADATSGKGTGALAESLGITPIVRDGDGYINAKIGFDGYDAKGTPNQLKARALESGTSKQPKRPFVRPAVNATRKRAEAEMGRVIEEEIRKLLGG